MKKELLEGLQRLPSSLGIGLQYHLAFHRSFIRRYAAFAKVGSTKSSILCNSQVSGSLSKSEANHTAAYVRRYHSASAGGISPNRIPNISSISSTEIESNLNNNKNNSIRKQKHSQYKIGGIRKPEKESFPLSTLDIQLRSILTLHQSDLAVLLNSPKRASLIWRALRNGIDPIKEIIPGDVSLVSSQIMFHYTKRNHISTSSIQSTMLGPNGETRIQLRLYDNHLIETNITTSIDKSRSSISISTQVDNRHKIGRHIGHTRNLWVHEILEQIFHGLHVIEEKKLPPLRNIVFLGMGDPGLNIANVKAALEVIIDNSRFGFALPFVTLSTIGPSVASFIELATLKANVSWSLYTSNEALRKKLLPESSKISLEELRDGYVEYFKRKESKAMKECLVMVVLITGLNDSIEDAEHLVEFLRPIQKVCSRLVVSLGPLDCEDVSQNISDRARLLQPPLPEAISQYYKVIKSHGIFCTTAKFNKTQSNVSEDESV